MYLTRKRHVKCDETKPFCRRCLLRSGTCDGYAPTKLKSRSFHNLPQRSLHPTLSRGRVTSTAVFRSSWERAWFETWILMSRELCGDELSELFTVTVTQLATQDDPLRHAIFAVGSLKFAIDQSAYLSSKRAYRASSYYRTALLRYGYALQVVTALPATDKTMRSILLCCTLFTCFGLIDGNRQSVHKHIQHGSRILEQFLLQKEHDASMKTCVASPAPSIVDDQIIQTFQRCTTLSYLQLGARISLIKSAQLANNFKEPAKFLGSHMPPNFNDLREAIKWLDIIQSALVTTLSSVDISLQASRGHVTDPNREEARLDFLRVLHDWSVAFAEVELTHERNGKICERRLIPTTLIRMQWHNAFIFVFTSHYTDYNSLVKMEYMFKSIIHLGKCFIKGICQKKLVTLLTTTGPVLPLFGKSSNIFVL